MKKTRIINKTKNFIISENAEIAKSALSRMKGLMFSGPKDMILEGKKDSFVESAIHMCFMKYPIDVLWVNSDLEIVDISNAVPLNIFRPETIKFYAPKRKAKYTIEIGAGKITGTEVGDKILFESGLESGIKKFKKVKKSEG